MGPGWALPSRMDLIRSDRRFLSIRRTNASMVLNHLVSSADHGKDQHMVSGVNDNHTYDGTVVDSSNMNNYYAPKIQNLCCSVEQWSVENSYALV